MKKALIVLLAILLVATAALALTACSPCKRGSHAWSDDVVITTEATCEQEGVKTLYCRICGTSTTEKIDKKAHTWDVEVDAVEPTCDTVGNVAYSHCSVCDKYYNAQGEAIEEGSWVIGSASGHQLGALIAQVDATCEQEGVVAHYHCSICGKDFEDESATTEIDDVVIPALGHIWKVATDNAWSWANDGSSVTLHLVCETNGAHTEDVTLTGEDISVDDSDAPTCEDGGKVIYSVSLTKQELVSKLTSGKLSEAVDATLESSKEIVGVALGHDYEGQEWLPDGSGNHYKECANGCGTHSATEKCVKELNWNDENHWKECTVCHEQTEEAYHDGEEVDFDSTGHWFVCETEGCESKAFFEEHYLGIEYGSDENEHWDKCTGCDFEDTANKTAHNVEWEVDKECHFGECVVCGEEVFDDHEITHHDAELSDDCRVMGTLAYDYCGVCGAYIVDGNVVGADELSDGKYGAHDLSHVDGQEASCTVNGVKDHYHCSVCDKNFENGDGTNEIADIVITAEGHQYADTWIHDGDAFGSHHMDCTVCGAVGRKTASCTISVNVCASCQYTYGTDEILEALFALSSGSSLNGTFELTGVVTAIVTDYNPTYGNVTVDISIGGKTVRVYRVKNATEANVSVANIAVGATITVRGNLTNYNGTFEFAQDCTLQDMVRPLYNVDVQIEPDEATVVDAQSGAELDSSYEVGTEISFKIIVNKGYAVVEVKVNDETLKANGGVYTFTVEGHTTIAVTLGEAGDVEPEDTYITLTAATLNFNSSGYANNNGDHIVGGVTFNTYQAYLKSGGSDIQGQAKNMVIKNVDAIPGRITKIEIIFGSGSSGTLKLSLGETDSSYIIVNSSFSTNYTYTNDGDTDYFFLKLESVASTVYISSITIYYEQPCDHDWQVDESVGNQGWTWNLEGEEPSATLTFKCSNCGKTREETAEVTYTDIYADCTSDGTRRYTATVTIDGGQNESDTYDKSIAAKGHTYDVDDWKHDNDNSGHYHECDECGEMVEEAKLPHVYSEYLGDNDDSNHWAECDKCGYELEEPHQFAETPSYVSGDATYHRYYCTAVGCEAYTEEAHSFDQDSKKCKCGAEEGHEHTLVWTNDDVQHWKHCSQQGCDYIDEATRANHVFNTYSSNGDAQHNAHCEICDANVVQDHTRVYEDDNDPESHIVSCELCEWEDIEDHNFVEGRCDKCDAEEPAKTKYFVKVENANTIEVGTYLIVYEAGNVILDASSTTKETRKTVTIADNKIEATEDILSSSFIITYENGNWYIASSSLSSTYYLGQNSDANGSTWSTTKNYNKTISVSNGDATIISSGGAYLRYNASNNPPLFRYYKSSSYTSQKAVQLYMLQA